jgi:hypothetical protein
MEQWLIDRHPISDAEIKAEQDAQGRFFRPPLFRLYADRYRFEALNYLHGE